MNSSEKGDELEDKFYEYLCEQKRRGELVYGLHIPENCKIFKKKGYFCKEREAKIQFDVVIEIFQKGREKPFSYVVFECKNYEGNIPETCVTDFSDKLTRTFRHAAKGVLVVSSRLQSGADKIARNRSIGIVKYNDAGIETIADRTGRYLLENYFLESQLFRNERRTKSLKFSAFYDGRYFGTVSDFLRIVAPEISVSDEMEDAIVPISVPYLSVEKIEQSAHKILEQVGYNSGPVDLGKICSMLGIDLQFSEQSIADEDGRPILGSANFDRKLININAHANGNRARFTLGHEIGHFVLNHDRYLRSENIVEQDFFLNKLKDNPFNYERLEIQANSFSSCLLLPSNLFLRAVDVARTRLDIRNRGHGYIFVDDQPCNSIPYDQLLSDVSSYFETSKQVVEIKLKQMQLLTDQRFVNRASPTARLFEDVATDFHE